MKSSDIAWAILTEDEQTSLVLSINYEKSTWQAGELMNKAHYKYLEIQARANKFFKMFTEYFEATGNLHIPSSLVLNTDFKNFIVHTVFERKLAKEAIREMGNTCFVIPTAKERHLREGLDNLANDTNPTHQLLYDLIIEFDRWNNSRILPITLQEPSAYKRRNKTRLIKHLKNLSNLDPYFIVRMTDKFKAKVGDTKVLYIPILSKSFEGGYDVIKIKNRPEVVEYISKNLRLYVFNEMVHAEEFAYLVNKYLSNEKKDCKTGQKFWPMYRKNIELASNYLEVNNILPRRKNLEQAFRDLDNLTIKKKIKNEKLKVSDPAIRANKKDFWKI